MAADATRTATFVFMDIGFDFLGRSSLPLEVALHYSCFDAASYPFASPKWRSSVTVENGLSVDGTGAFRPTASY
jgi:hypothetical protein